MKYRLKTQTNYNLSDSDTALFSLLTDRGIERPSDWLYPSEYCEHPNKYLKNIAQAINMLHKHLVNKSCIYIQVD